MAAEIPIEASRLLDRDVQTSKYIHVLPPALPCTFRQYILCEQISSYINRRYGDIPGATERFIGKYNTAVNLKFRFFLISATAAQAKHTRFEEILNEL